MSDLSELVLDAAEHLVPLYKKSGDETYMRDVVDAYLKLVDVIYRHDISKCLAYKKLFFDRVRLG